MFILADQTHIPLIERSEKWPGTVESSQWDHLSSISKRHAVVSHSFLRILKLSSDCKLLLVPVLPNSIHQFLKSRPIYNESQFIMLPSPSPLNLKNLADGNDACGLKLREEKVAEGRRSAQDTTVYVSIAGIYDKYDYSKAEFECTFEIYGPVSISPLMPEILPNIERRRTCDQCTHAPPNPSRIEKCDLEDELANGRLDVYWHVVSLPSYINTTTHYASNNRLCCLWCGVPMNCTAANCEQWWHEHSLTTRCVWLLVLTEGTFCAGGVTNNEIAACSRSQLSDVIGNNMRDEFRDKTHNNSQTTIRGKPLARQSVHRRKAPTGFVTPTRVAEDSSKHKVARSCQDMLTRLISRSSSLYRRCARKCSFENRAISSDRAIHIEASKSSAIAMNNKHLTGTIWNAPFFLLARRPLHSRKIITPQRQRAGRHRSFRRVGPAFWSAARAIVAPAFTWIVLLFALVVRVDLKREPSATAISQWSIGGVADSIGIGTRSQKHHKPPDCGLQTHYLQYKLTGADACEFHNNLIVFV